MLHDVITGHNLHERWKKILQEVPKALSPDSKLSIAYISLQLQNLMKFTSIENVCILIQKWETDDSTEEKEAYAVRKEYKLNECDSESKITSSVVSMEEDVQLFSGIDHATEDRVRIKVDAWAQNEKNLANLAQATGNLFYFCRALQQEVKDPRGSSAEVVERGIAYSMGGNMNSSHPSCLEISLEYSWIPPSAMANFEALRSAVVDHNHATLHRFNRALETMEKKQMMKFVYLVGITGEGKSTLANRLSGVTSFPVSHAGTGTFEIRCV